jgi:hypothetical protein
MLSESAPPLLRRQDKQAPSNPISGSPALLFLGGLGCLREDLLKFVNRRSASKPREQPLEFQSGGGEPATVGSPVVAGLRNRLPFQKILRGSKLANRGSRSGVRSGVRGRSAGPNSKFLISSSIYTLTFFCEEPYLQSIRISSRCRLPLLGIQHCMPK